MQTISEILRALLVFQKHPPPHDNESPQDAVLRQVSLADQPVNRFYAAAMPDLTRELPWLILVKRVY